MDKIKELKRFPECDGHIESILIGCRMAKVSFQTWDTRELVLIYDDVDSVKEQNSVFGDISEYTISKGEDGGFQYSFTDINCALFNVGYEYIGRQHLE